MENKEKRYKKAKKYTRTPRRCYAPMTLHDKVE